MWNRNIRMVWVNVHLNAPRRFHLSLPVSFYAFEELLDCITDLLDFASLFLRKDRMNYSTAMSLHSIRELLKGTVKLFDALTGTEPYELVQVETKDVAVSIRIL